MRLSFHEYVQFKEFLKEYWDYYLNLTGGVGAVTMVFWSADPMDDSTYFVTVEVLFFRTELVASWAGFHRDPEKLVKEVAELVDAPPDRIYKGGVSA